MSPFVHICVISFTSVPMYPITPSAISDPNARIARHFSDPSLRADQPSCAESHIRQWPSTQLFVQSTAMSRISLASSKKLLPVTRSSDHWTEGFSALIFLLFGPQYLKLHIPSVFLSHSSRFICSLPRLRYNLPDENVCPPGCPDHDQLHLHVQLLRCLRPSRRRSCASRDPLTFW